MAGQGIGAAVARKEDPRFLVGRGTYTDDINRPGQAYAYLVRSPYAHARVTGIDTAAARAADGVVAVLTGADVAADKIGGIPCGWLVHSKDGKPMVEPPHTILAMDRVRHVGDPVAMVIAGTRAQAKAAAGLVEVTYDELPVIASSAGAVADGAPVVWEQAPGNVCFHWAIGDAAATEAAFAKAAHVVSLDLVQNRLVANAMEPRAAIGEFEVSSGELTLYTTSQNPHLIRLLMAAFVMGVPEHKLRVVAPDVGGGFGSKIFHYAEEVLVTWAARRIGRPVKWTAERSESFVSDAQGRDHVTKVELALDADGIFLGMKVDTIANLGAYLSLFAACVPTYLYGTLFAGCYRTPAIYGEVRGVFTNTVPVDAYRGAGRPEACYLIERVVDHAARQLGMDPVEIRRKNFIPTTAFPYQTPVALVYDVGDYHTTLEVALDKSDWRGFPARRAEAAARGKLRGIGISTYIEACGIAPSAVVGSLGARAGLFEYGQVRVHPTGSVTVFTGSHSHGQGHETAFAQIVNSYLGVPIEQVDVVHGDTSKIGFGMGTYGSRSAAVGGTAIVKALDKVIAKAKKIAAHLLEVSAGDVTLSDGVFKVAGTDRQKTFGEVALAAYVPHNFPHEELEPGLDESAFYDPKNFTYPAGCHVVEVEIDPETGVVAIVNVTAADDVGIVINPLIVDGQLHGGLAQGIGQALLENTVYDDNGQLLTGSYMNYCMPRASDLPSFNVGFHVTACTHNPLGVKGCGEMGAIGVPPAVVNAAIDALAPLGVTHLDMPLTPEKVWRAIRAAKEAV
ncbi:MAG: xanthine dehydrogenase family protein molybdopterin-binding subunit [Deltaproteobacteria bacterium]|nr:xanthine dehydrogenase family protein molybdopterin-binding subunit [Deltaproteobacteria bacterium]